jgi:hypothetical protein
VELGRDLFVGEARDVGALAGVLDRQTADIPVLADL